MVQNLDPQIRKFLLYTISETFAEIRKFVEYRQYDREKVRSGILELCAALQMDLSDEIQFESDKPKVTNIEYLNCLFCGRRKTRKERVHFPYHVHCETRMRRELGKSKILGGKR